MTYRSLHLLMPLFLSVALTQSAARAEAPKDEKDELFYSLGVMFAQTLGEFQLSEEELALVMKGVKESVAGTAAPLDMQSLQPRIAALHRERATVAAAGERAASEAFVAEAAAQPGVEKTESGIVISIFEPGEGASPKVTDTVKVHYHGTLRNGTVFDSSRDRGVPVEFPLNGVIPCWKEGVQKMKVGGKARLVCPSDLAYGDRGAPPKIPGGAALVFEIDLLSIGE